MAKKKAAVAAETKKARYPDPVCGINTCFGYSDGKCTILINNDFGGRKCPFYKRSRSEIKR